MIHVTFYNEKIDPEIVSSQKKVFDFFGIEIRQVVPDEWRSHAESIDTWIKRTPFISGKNEVIFIWDIDCIPLSREVVDFAEREALKGSLVGIRQHASHIADSIDYVGPAFMAFSLETFALMGMPSFKETERSDCGAELTHAAIRAGIKRVFLEPSHVEVPKWKLNTGHMFGIGTTFGGKSGVFHAFLSRKGNIQTFIRKCLDTVLVTAEG